MKKPDTKLHCPRCGCKRNTALHIQRRPKYENDKPEIVPISPGALLKLLKRNTVETQLLQGGLFASTCPQCMTTTPYMVNKDRKLVMVEL